MRNWTRFVIVAMLAFAPALLGVHELRAETTLDKILKEKKIRIACDVASPPFGAIGSDGQPDGSR